jgi:hypothetical protein
MPLVYVDRVRLLLALALVAVGSPVAAGGPASLGRLASLVIANIHVPLLVLAAILILVSALPRGTRLGPMILIAGGLTAYAVTHGQWRAGGLWTAMGALLVLLGGRIALLPGSRRERIDPVWRVTAVLFPRTLAVGKGERAPEQIAVVAIGTRVVVDLREPGRVDEALIELSLSCWAGHIEILLPDSWSVVGGRLASARGVTFRGQLDSTKLFADPRNQEMYEKLINTGAARRERHQEPTGVDPAVVVVHVLGFGGAVELGTRS